MTIEISIRRYSADDCEDVVRLILAIQQEEFGIKITRAEQPDLAEIPSFYQSGLGGFWVAEQGGEIVGTIALRDIGNEQVALRKMFVASQARGQKFGTAAKLLSTLIEHANGVGVRDIFLGTALVLVAAHRFYEKNGFVEIEPSALPADFPVMAVDRKFYCRSL
jgi:N-acetylglutamate synthase-like GNAT family acetyltransferase